MVMAARSAATAVAAAARASARWAALVPGCESARALPVAVVTASRVGARSVRSLAALAVQQQQQQRRSVHTTRVAGRFHEVDAEFEGGDAPEDSIDSRFESFKSKWLSGELDAESEWELDVDLRAPRVDFHKNPPFGGEAAVRHGGLVWLAPHLTGHVPSPESGRDDGIDDGAIRNGLLEAGVTALDRLKGALGGSLNSVERVVRSEFTLHCDADLSKKHAKQYREMLVEVLGESGGPGVISIASTTKPLGHRGALVQLECTFALHRQRQQRRESGRGDDGDGGSGQPATKRVFLGGLAQSVHEASLTSFIEREIGETPVSVTVLYDRISGISKGCGFVSLSPEKARVLLAKCKRKELELDDWVVRASYARDDPSRGDGGGGGYGGGGAFGQDRGGFDRGGGRGFDRGRNNRGGDRREERGRGGDRRDRRDEEREPSEKLVVFNVPFDATVDDVAPMFPGAVSVDLQVGRDGRPRGTCVVQYPSVDEAVAFKESASARELELGGRRFRVDYEVERW